MGEGEGGRGVGGVLSEKAMAPYSSTLAWKIPWMDLIQFSVDGWGCVPSLLLDLRSNYGGGNEDNGDLLQKEN